MEQRRRPTDYLTREEILHFRVLSEWRSSLMILHCWASIFTVWVICSVWTNPITVGLGILLIGTRQLGLDILNHDGAHFLLYKNKKVNDWVCEWLLNRPTFGASVVPYRKYHLEHHRFTQQEKDPDLHLSAPFPISKSSLRRKLWRDLSGQTGYKQRKELFLRVAGRLPDSAKGPESRLVLLLRLWNRFGPNLVINLVFFTGFALTGHWYLYFVLWVLPVLTWYQLITRVRNIGEHGAVPDNADRLRNTRTTSVNWLERVFLAPYFVNYHLEHHLQVSCPCYSLKRMHEKLVGKGLGAEMELKQGYLAVLKHATAV
ncbi:MAG: fatty acid desaturase family protein [Pseudomonadales bacterium]|nr:fatty acid desaturase family protein [Pseudomonadales bacterium]